MVRESGFGTKALIAAATLWSAIGSPAGAQMLMPEDAARSQDDAYSAADSSAPVVTLDNLYESERFWPHQVELVESWRPRDQEGPFGWGVGVLLRVEESGLLRVDFSRFGKHQVPAGATNVVARANEIRTGRSEKFAPNLVLALRNRLMDPTKKTLTRYGGQLLDQDAFVLVYADPRALEFPAIASAVAPLHERSGVLAILLAQGDLKDSEIHFYALKHGWEGLFLMDRLVAAYTEGMLAAADAPITDDGTAQEERPRTSARPPAIQLLSPEGKLHWTSGWREDATPGLRSALERLRRESSSDDGRDAGM